MEEIVVHMFPARGGTNAYIGLLTQALDGATSGAYAYRTEPRTLPRLLLSVLRHLSKKRIIHIHWPHVLYGSRFATKSLLMMAFWFPSLLLLQTCFRCYIVWTKHNASAHDYPHPWIDRMGSAFIFHVAKTVIVHQASEAKRMHCHKVRYIPHGNYCGVYGTATAERAAERRRMLGIANDDIVVIALGIMKPYKKIDAIIDTFNAPAVRTIPNLKLILAGACNAQYQKFLKECIGGNVQILFLEGHVMDRDVSEMLRMTNYAIFWYDDSVLTSGGIILALSYGVPVIARDIPAADMIENGKNGFLYRNKEELVRMLTDLPNRRRPDADAVLTTVREHHWQEIAAQTAWLYSGLLEKT